MPRQLKRNRCKQCPGCLAKDCGECRPCRDSTKFGGPGKSHSCCIHRLCHVLYPEVGKEGRRIRERRNPVSTPDTPTSTNTSKDDTPTPASATLEPQVKTVKLQYVDKPQNGENNKVQNDNVNTPRPKRKRVEPKRIQDSLDRPQWLHRTKPSSAAAVNGAEGRKRTTEEVRTKSSRSSSLKHSGDLDFLRNSPLASSDEPSINLPTPALENYLENRIRAQDTTKPHCTKVEESNTMYGHQIPDAPPENTCAGCLGLRDRELENNPIVLCDGEGCGREYHLNCCVPALSDEKEQDRWLCQDCCPNGGSTAFLIKYLEESDSRKADFIAQSIASDPHAAFVDHLLREDSKRENKGLDRFPVSQLERGALTDATARSDTVSRTRRGQEQTEPLTPEFFVGKSVRIFSLVGSQYHTGRIVDFRLISKSPNHSTHNDFEFLVRFPAGTEGRKKSYRHWIVLEEHGTCVGTTLVWAGMPDGSWQPSILWLRTARELIPIQHHLIESEGQIQYRPANETLYDEIGTPIKSNFKVLGLVRPFGYQHVFHTLNAKDRMMDLFHHSALDNFLNGGKTILQFELAKTEFEERERVRKWRALKLVNPMGYYALSSADTYSLESLQPPNYGQVASESHAALCPTVPRGLDRQKLLTLIQRRCGMEPSKDVGAALTCRIMDFNSDMLWEQEEKQHSNGKATKNGTVESALPTS